MRKHCKEAMTHQNNKENQVPETFNSNVQKRQKMPISSGGRLSSSSTQTQEKLVLDAFSILDSSNQVNTIDDGNFTQLNYVDLPLNNSFEHVLSSNTIDNCANHSSYSSSTVEERTYAHESLTTNIIHPTNSGERTRLSFIYQD